MAGSAACGAPLCDPGIAACSSPCCGADAEGWPPPLPQAARINRPLTVAATMAGRRDFRAFQGMLMRWFPPLSKVGASVQWFLCASSRSLMPFVVRTWNTPGHLALLLLPFSRNEDRDAPPRNAKFLGRAAGRTVRTTPAGERHGNVGPGQPRDQRSGSMALLPRPVTDISSIVSVLRVSVCFVDWCSG